MPLQITKNQLMPLNPGTTPPPPGGYVVAARATSEPQNLSGITPMIDPMVRQLAIDSRFGVTVRTFPRRFRRTL